MTRTTERRFNPTQLRAARSQSPGSAGQIVGYAATFNKKSRDLGNFKEICAPGCFANSLRRGDDVRCNVNHDPSMIVARSRTGTLRLSEDNVGLRIEADVADTSVGRDLMENVRTGLISEMSFAFTVDQEDWSDANDEETNSLIAIRTLGAVSLLDVAPVVFPAYDATSLSSMDPSMLLGRSHSFESMFPDGVTAEMRSRVPALRNLKPQESRRKLLNLFLS
jgi:HK97 family phage prohead protease